MKTTESKPIRKGARMVIPKTFYLSKFRGQKVVVVTIDGHWITLKVIGRTKLAGTYIDIMTGDLGN